MAETSDLGFEDPSFAEQVPHENGAVDGGANGALDADMFSSGASPPVRWSPCQRDRERS